MSLFQEYVNIYIYSSTCDFISQIASESILKDLKSQIFICSQTPPDNAFIAPPPTTSKS